MGWPNSYTNAITGTARRPTNLPRNVAEVDGILRERGIPRLRAQPRAS